MVHKVKCPKKELLGFIKKGVWKRTGEYPQNIRLDLDGVHVKLIRLSKQGLVKSFGRGNWVLNVDGIRRLDITLKKTTSPIDHNDPPKAIIFSIALLNSANTKRLYLSSALPSRSLFR
jgi:hypothetical protein